MPQTSRARAGSSPSPGSPARQHVLTGVVRLILFAVVGIAGWVFGSLVGLGIGIAIDLVLVAGQPSGPGATVVSTIWGTAFIGATVGLLGSIIWLAARMARSAS